MPIIGDLDASTSGEGRVILSISLSLPDDADIHEMTDRIRVALAAEEYRSVVRAVDDGLRNKIKYGDLPAQVREALQAIRDLLWEEVTSRGLARNGEL